MHKLISENGEHVMHTVEYLLRFLGYQEEIKVE